MEKKAEKGRKQSSTDLLEGFDCITDFDLDTYRNNNNNIDKGNQSSHEASKTINDSKGDMTKNVKSVAAINGLDSANGAMKDNPENSSVNNTTTAENLENDQANSVTNRKKKRVGKKKRTERIRYDIHSETFSYNECLKNAENGEPNAQLAVGKCYLEGVHVSKNAEQGVDWLIRSSEQCNKEATSLLAQCQRERIGITIQNKSDIIWCVISSNREKKSRMAIAKMYMESKSAEQLAEFSSQKEGNQNDDTEPVSNINVQSEKVIIDTETNAKNDKLESETSLQCEEDMAIDSKSYNSIEYEQENNTISSIKEGVIVKEKFTEGDCSQQGSIMLQTYEEFTVSEETNEENHYCQEKYATTHSDQTIFVNEEVTANAASQSEKSPSTMVESKAVNYKEELFEKYDNNSQPESQVIQEKNHTPIRIINKFVQDNQSIKPQNEDLRDNNYDKKLSEDGRIEISNMTNATDATTEKQSQCIYAASSAKVTKEKVTNQVTETNNSEAVHEEHDGDSIQKAEKAQVTLSHLNRSENSSKFVNVMQRSISTPQKTIFEGSKEALTKSDNEIEQTASELSIDTKYPKSNIVEDQPIYNKQDSDIVQISEKAQSRQQATSSTLKRSNTLSKFVTANQQNNPIPQQRTNSNSSKESLAKSDNEIERSVNKLPKDMKFPDDNNSEDQLVEEEIRGSKTFTNSSNAITEGTPKLASIFWEVMTKHQEEKKGNSSQQRIDNKSEMSNYTTEYNEVKQNEVTCQPDSNQKLQGSLIGNAFKEMALYKDDKNVVKELTPEELFKQHLQRAREGDAEAQLQISNFYFEGFGVKRNRREALQWLKLSSESGNPQAKEMLQDYEDENYKIKIRRKASIRWQSAAGLALERYVEAKENETDDRLKNTQSRKMSNSLITANALQKLMNDTQRGEDLTKQHLDNQSIVDKDSNINKSITNLENDKTDHKVSLKPIETAGDEQQEILINKNKNTAKSDKTSGKQEIDEDWGIIAKLPPLQRMKMSIRKIFISYPKRTLLAAEDFIVDKASQHSEEFFQSLIPTEQLQTLLLLFIYTNCTSALLLTILPPLFFLISYMILVVCSLLIFKQRNATSNYQIWKKFLVKKQHSPSLQQPQSIESKEMEMEPFMPRPYIIFSIVLCSTLIFFALANKSWLPCPELALMSLFLALTGFTLLSTQNDIAIMAAMMRVASALFASTDNIPTWLPLRWFFTIFSSNFASTEILGGLQLNFSLVSCIHFVFPGLLVTMASRYNWQGTYKILMPHLVFIAWWQLTIEFFHHSSWAGLLRGSVGWLAAFSLLGVIFGMIIRLLLRCGIVDRLFRVVATAAVPQTLVDQGLVDNEDENEVTSAKIVKNAGASGIKKKTIFYMVVGILTVVFIISNIPKSNPKSKITWSQYVSNCGPPAWRLSNKANVQVHCRQLADQVVSWSGEIEAIEVIEIENQFQAMFSNLPWIAHQWLSCAFGQKVAACDKPDDPICRLRQQEGCNLHNNDEYKFQIRVIMPAIQKINESEVLLEAEHDFASQISQLRQGVLADFNGVLKSNLGGDTPVLELISINYEGLKRESIYQDNASLMVLHFILQFLFYPLMKMEFDY